MIQSIWVQNQNGARLDLPLRTSIEENNIAIYNVEGLGSPVATVNGTGGPGFDGIRVNSIRTDARHITISFAIPNAGDREEEAKALLYQFFPVKQYITLGVKTDKRNIYIDAYVEQNEMTQFSQMEGSTVSLYCPKPYFIDIFSWDYSVTRDTGIPLFEFPFSNESLTEDLLIFSEVTEYPTVRINYIAGVTSGVYITLLLGGAVTGLQILNGNGSQVMNLDTSLPLAYFGGPTEDGDQIMIGTHPGSKWIYYVRDGEFFNMIAGVGLQDDWIEVRPGVNTIVTECTTGVAYLTMDLSFSPLREGV